MTTAYDSLLRQDLLVFWRNTYNYLIDRLEYYGMWKLNDEDYRLLDEMGSRPDQMFDDEWKDILDIWASRGVKK